MRTVSDCLTCILGDVYVAAQQTSDEATALQVARAASDYLAHHFDYTLPPSYHITQVHRILKQIAGLAEPFAERRRQANDVGRQIAARVAQEAETFSFPMDTRRQRIKEEKDPSVGVAHPLDSQDRFRHLAVWALAANSLDSRTVGTGYTFDPAGAYDYLFGYVQRGLAVDQLDMLYRLVREHRGGGAGEQGSREDPPMSASGSAPPHLCTPTPPRVLYVHDNVGEMALDAVFIRELRRLGCHVTSAVRGGPITSDATWVDALYLGLDKEADALILAGPDTLGVSFAEMSPEMRAELQRADLVISKGQANYYVFSEYRNQVPGQVFCLFTVKCQAVGRVLGVERRATIAAFL